MIYHLLLKLTILALWPVGCRKSIQNITDVAIDNPYLQAGQS